MFQILRLLSVLLPGGPPLLGKGSFIGISPLECKWVQLCLILSKVGFLDGCFSILARWGNDNPEFVKLRKKEAFVCPF